MPPTSIGYFLNQKRFLQVAVVALKQCFESSERIRQFEKESNDARYLDWNGPMPALNGARPGMGHRAPQPTCSALPWPAPGLL